MAALVQTLTPSTSTMLQQRPNSADRYNSGPNHHHSGSRSSQKYGSTSSTGYRGVPSSGPVAPYAFTTTPSLGNNSTHRSQSSSPSLNASAAPQLPVLNLSGTTWANSLMLSKPTPTSTPTTLNTTPKQLDDQSASQIAGKVAPDRYRRNIRRTDTAESVAKPQGSALPSGSGMAAVGSLYSHPSQSSSTPSLSSTSSYRGPQQTKITDDMQLGKQSTTEPASRYRRRSLVGLETAGITHQLNDANDQSTPHPNEFIPPIKGGDYMSVQPIRPTSAHKHTGSSESAGSGNSSRPGSSRNPSSTQTVQQSQAPQIGHIAKQMVNTPNRSNDRRTPSGVTTPSPLSRPMSPNAEQEQKNTPIKVNKPVQVQAPSPAAAHLAALNLKEAKKSKSKLRRAFSFGSAAELRKVTAQANLEKSNANTNKRISRHEEELDPESARIAAKQEAAGLGESIYSGQGHFFTGSTDNLSISSTASSASIMLRKMGQGIKKGGRSLTGLFRPKSVIGVQAADGPLHEASAAQVSMVTVEAEREKVNVNLDPHAHHGGGTGYPKLERNSIDNKMSIDSGSVSTEARSRRSIVGGERERAEVLATLKKGILKRTDSNQSSPTLRPIDARAPELTLPIGHTDSPRSSAPSTPKDDQLPGGLRQTDSVKINETHDDYFGASSPRYESLDSKSGHPITPTRNITFSPRVQQHETWPPTEYDRRGEIATCNRLTPMLAQQIKEELNSFKMVCLTNVV